MSKLTKFAAASAAVLALAVPLAAQAESTAPEAMKAVIAATQQAFIDNPEAAKATFAASSRVVEGFRTEATMRGHSVTVDFTEGLGGTDAGPSPVELVLASVGTCQAMTYQAFAAALEIPVDEITVDVEGDIDLRGFLAVDEAVRPGFEAMRISVRLVSSASDEQIGMLRQMANAHCPLLDIVSNQTPVETVITHEAP